MALVTRTNCALAPSSGKRWWLCLFPIPCLISEKTLCRGASSTRASFQFQASRSSPRSVPLREAGPLLTRLAYRTLLPRDGSGARSAPRASRWSARMSAWHSLVSWLRSVPRLAAARRPCSRTLTTAGRERESRAQPRRAPRAVRLKRCAILWRHLVRTMLVNASVPTQASLSQCSIALSKASRSESPPARLSSRRTRTLSASASSASPADESSSPPPPPGRRRVLSRSHHVAL